MLLMTVLLGSCAKTEFSIEGNIKGAGTQNLRLIYYASSSQGGVVTEAVMPMVDGKFSYTGRSERPVVIWIFAPNRMLLTPIYVEPGDDVKITGDFSEPYKWKVSGNNIERQWNEWRSKNSDALKTGNDKMLNDIISKYVKDNPDSPISALSMLCFFVRRDNALEFDKVWKLLSEDARPEDLVNAVESTKNHQSAKAYTVKVSPLTLYSITDSVESLAVPKRGAMLLYFWRQGEDDHKFNIKNLKKLRKEYPDTSIFRIADINMDTDTLKWRRSARRDSATIWERYWAIGGEMNLSLRRLEVARTPYYILVDSVGNQAFRGDNFSKLEKRIKEVLKKK